MIPLIQGLLARGARVWLAGSGPIASLLSSEFPRLPILELEGYGIRYPKQGRFFVPAMFSQLPQLLNAISREKVWLDQMQAQIGWDMVISDNRYGLHHPKTLNILVTHQLYPKSGSILLPETVLHRAHRRLMRPFDEVWIPDLAGPGNLSGSLSHPPLAATPSHYIGPLSRLLPSLPGSHHGPEAGQYLLALLSGPEPQRGILEEKILLSARGFNNPVVLVRGLPGEEPVRSSVAGVTMINHADPATLSMLIADARYVICRSGYSTVMDLVRLGKKALLVPTPGQTEQEYLAGLLASRGYFPTISQERFSLSAAHDMLEKHPGTLPGMDFNAYERFLDKRFTQPDDQAN